MLRLTRVPVLAAVLLAVAVAGPAYASGARYPYTLVDPGTFGGPASFFDGPGVPLTSQGTLVGAADTSTADSDYPNCAPPGGCYDPYVQHAFAWSNGRLTDLGALPGENSSAIYELNNYGIGVGSSENGLEDPNTRAAATSAVMFNYGHVINLGTLPGGNESFAQDINDQGQVAGNSSNGTPDPFSFFGWGTQTRGFIWQNGVMTDLGTLGGADTIEYNLNLGFTNWMNNRGEVVGQSNLAGDQTTHPFLWNGRQMIDLGTLGGDFGNATWVNDAGDVIGNSLLSDETTWNGFLWHDGKRVDLPPIDGAAWSGANSINDQGQIVGTINDTSGDQLAAVLWSNGNAYDLNTLVAPSSLQLISGEYINDHGDIVSTALLNGDRRIVLLIPNHAIALPRTPAPSRPRPAGSQPDTNPTALRALDATSLGGVASPRIRRLMLSRRP